MRAFLIIILLLSVGCMTNTANMVASIYSVTESGESEFDGTRWVRVKSIWCDPITFDLYQDANLSRSDLASLELNIGGAHSIQAGKSLHMNIDGDFVDLSTLEHLTNIETKPGYYTSGLYSGISFYIPPHNVSSKRYLVEMNLLERMARAEELIMKIDLTREHIEAVCTNENSSGSTIPAASTRYGIKKFIEDVALKL